MQPISGASPMMNVRRTTNVQAAPAPVKAAPVKAPVQVAQPQHQPWTLGRITKAAGSGVAGFAAGGLGTAMVDLFFHFGNNGGTAWPGGIYLTAALGLGAAAALAYGWMTEHKK